MVLRSAVGPGVVLRSAVGPGVVLRSTVGPGVVLRSAVGPGVAMRSVFGPRVVLRSGTGLGLILRSPPCSRLGHCWSKQVWLWPIIGLPGYLVNSTGICCEDVSLNSCQEPCWHKLCPGRLVLVLHPAQCLLRPMVVGLALSGGGIYSSGIFCWLAVLHARRAMSLEVHVAHGGLRILPPLHYNILAY